jgi:hypothetical protein
MDYSVIEFAVYGFFAYGSMLMLMISMIKEMPVTRSLSIVRCMYAIPGLFSAIILSGFGTKIIFPITNTNSTILSFNTTEYFYANATMTTENILMNPVWTYFHGLLAAILIVFVIFQILQLLTNPD